jgi:hypothetical protein
VKIVLTNVAKVADRRLVDTSWRRIVMASRSP